MFVWRSIATRKEHKYCGDSDWCCYFLLSPTQSWHAESELMKMPTGNRCELCSSMIRYVHTIARFLNGPCRFSNKWKLPLTFHDTIHGEDQIFVSWLITIKKRRAFVVLNAAGCILHLHLLCFQHQSWHKQSALVMVKQSTQKNKNNGICIHCSFDLYFLHNGNKHIKQKRT